MNEEQKQPLSSPDVLSAEGGALGASSCPKHIAIIMDGNNRWAKERGLAGSAGHKEGAKAVKATVKNCVRKGIKALTVFAFSSENWRRPPEEVELLMQLFLDALQSEVAELNDNGVRLRFVGDLSTFSPELRSNMRSAMTLTQDNDRFTFNVAVNYGGRWDITQAVKTIAAQVHRGHLDVNEIDERLVDSCLALADLPAVDLCIRTSGEQRISNFLLWQIAYAELYFAPCLWPDFDANELDLALEVYSTRQRRFGRTSEQVISAQQKASAPLPDTAEQTTSSQHPQSSSAHSEEFAC